MTTKKKSFLERLAGGIRLDEEETEEFSSHSSRDSKKSNYTPKEEYESKDKNVIIPKEQKWEEEIDAELTVDLYQNPNEIIVQTMVAGVQPDNLSITITRDMIIIRGKREENKSIEKDNYFIQELYWGSFSRTISLPEEIDPEGAEAVEKHGLLIIKLPKVDKHKETKLKIKSI